MPIIADPETELPDKTKNVRPSQLIMWLLFPVVFAVGFTVGLVVGIKQGSNAVASQNNARANSSVIPNTNTRIVANIPTVNTNTTNAFTNLSNSAVGGGDYLKVTANTQTVLDAKRQQDIDHVVDQTTSVTDQIRQRDLINMKYDLLVFFSVETRYPSTGRSEIKIEAKADEVMYNQLKQFYGGTYNLRVDPESPSRFYSYTSDGSSFTLSAYLTGPQKVFIQTDK